MSNSYTVLDKEEIMQFDRIKGMVRMMRIRATSAGGTVFTVDCPVDQLDQAPKLLDAKAKAIDAIQ